MIELTFLDEQIEILRDYISREEGKKEKIEEQLQSFNKKLEEIEQELELLEKVMILYQKTSSHAREQAKKQIEILVTKCLQYIFESNVEFVIELDELRNKANAEFYVISDIDGLVIKTRPELSRGGGVVDIVSLALRIAFLQINKPPIDGPLILDEPVKHVSEDYIFNVGNFLKQTSEMFSRQIIMITHNDHLSALSNNSFRMELQSSVSSLTTLDD